MMIKELFSNLAILTSLIFIYTQFTLTTSLKRSSSVSKKITTGILGGLLGNVLMQYSMHHGNTIIDLRHIPVILLAFYGGSLPAVISMSIVIIGRLVIGVNASSFSAILLIISITVMAIVLSKRKTLSKKLKIFSILTFSNIAFSVLVTYLIMDYKILMALVPVYWGISYLAGFISFYMVEYLRKSQRLFNQYKEESMIDSLTGLNNVRKFDEDFNSVLKNLELKEEQISLLFIDIDHFKNINDTYGHSEGDVVLKELGVVLSKSVRSFDIVSRNGGEEFSVILLDCPKERAMIIGEAIRRNVEKSAFVLDSGTEIHISVSIGAASYPETTETAAMLIKDADHALYEAKKSGRNRVCSFQSKEPMLG